MRLITVVFLLSCGAALGQNPGIITTVAGIGVAGFSGDGIPAAQSRLNLETSDNAEIEEVCLLHIDAAGNLYIPDKGNNRVRRVSPDGMITTVAGNGTHAYGGDGRPATQAALDWPVAAVTDSAGNLLIADQHNSRLRRVGRDGIITTIVGVGQPGFSGNGGQATAAGIDYPSGMAFDGGGNLYFSDTFNNQVRRVSTSGVITGFAGTTEHLYGGDGGPATRAALDFPAGLAFDRAGNLYIADQHNNRVRRVSTDGVITTVAGGPRAGFSGDGGPAAQALLNYPAAVAFDAAGNLYIADQRNHRVRRVSPAGIITTVAGNGTGADRGDGGPALEASLNRPSGLAFDAAGNLYIADHYNHRVRRVSFVAPASGGITNAASFATGPIARGQLISIFGTNLGPATGVGLALDPSGRVATSLAGVSVLFNDLPGALFFARQDQINVQVPYELGEAAAARIVVRYLDASSSVVTAPLAASAPGIFTVAGGRGQAALLNEDFSLNSPANPAAPGGVVQIFLTGQGATDPPAITGQLPQAPFPAPLLAVSVMIGGLAARTTSVGLAPGLAGLLQVNAVVPAEAPAGDAVPLSVTIGQAASQPGATLAVSSRQ